MLQNEALDMPNRAFLLILRRGLLAQVVFCASVSLEKWSRTRLLVGENADESGIWHAGIDAGRDRPFYTAPAPMNALRCVPLLLAVLLTGSVLHAETPEERAKVVRVTINLTEDVPPGAIAQFVEAISKIKVHYTPRAGEATLTGMSFENATVDEALQYLAKQANLVLTYEADGAHLTPKK
jgi:hypothetical protein